MTRIDKDCTHLLWDSKGRQTSWNPRFLHKELCNINLTREYEKLHANFGWDETHFLQCNLNAIRAAFLPETIKQQLENKLQEGYHNI